MGLHDVVYDRGNKALLVDGYQFLSLQAANVILLTEASGTLSVAATDSIDVDIGEASPLAALATDRVDSAHAEHFSWIARFLEQLREHLRQRRSVTDSLKG